MSKKRIEPGPGQESVWDYPRPPACEKTAARIQIYLDDEVLVDTTGAYRVLETSHPPKHRKESKVAVPSDVLLEASGPPSLEYKRPPEVYYVPPQDVKMQKLKKASGQSSFCEWKGSASYYDAGARKAIAWAYASPTPRFLAIKDYLAFYPSKVDKALVDGEEVKAQEGDFYGGWITSSVVGPFKGGLGSWGW